MKTQGLLVFTLTISLYSCHISSQKKQITAVTVPVEHTDPTPDQKIRRQQSESICRQHNIPIYSNPNAMFVDAEAQTSIRPQDSVIDRALALVYTALKAQDYPAKRLDSLAKAWAITDKLSPNEKELVRASKPTDRQKTDAIWKY
ncbi:MAG: DUF4272 domain-containing protein, partial [Bacteroidetes bacterium]|nr:DUF4272 domain-containing protein [Bacteroidota bacterium]